MLVYVNQFKFMHNNNSDVIFTMISQWLNQMIEIPLTIDDLKQENQLISGDHQMNTYLTIQDDARLHSIQLKHPDKTVEGREWLTEITLRIKEEILHISILLKTIEQHTPLENRPLFTQPPLIKAFIEHSNFAKSMIGLSACEFSNHSADFEKINNLIKDKNRDYPIILISHLASNNQPLVSPQNLQEKLKGFGQVFYPSEKINHYKLTTYLSRQYAAWDGAINIIFPFKEKEENCTNKLFYQADIKDWNAQGINISEKISSQVIQMTNQYKQQYHLNQDDIRIQYLSNELSTQTEYLNLVEEDIEKLRLKNTKLNEQYKAIKQELKQTKQDKEFFEMRFNELQQHTDNKGQTLLCYGHEHDLYQGEINDFILEILKKASKNAKKHSRKQDILLDILEYNKITNTKTKFIEHCKTVFTNYHSITPKIKEVLRKLNLEIKTEGVHHHMQFIHDKRYKMTFSKSPSDGRTGNNIISQMKRIFF